jgi:hypothetical protein
MYNCINNKLIATFFFNLLDFLTVQLSYVSRVTTTSDVYFYYDDDLNIIIYHQEVF